MYLVVKEYHYPDKGVYWQKAGIYPTLLAAKKQKHNLDSYLRLCKLQASISVLIVELGLWH